MDWTRLRLSLALAVAMVLILLRSASLARRAGSLPRPPASALVEALLALPLVLPPTVLGFYLLVGDRGPSPLGACTSACSARRSPSVSRACCRQRHLQHAVRGPCRCSAPSRRSRRTCATPRGRAACRPGGRSVRDRAAAGLAWHRHRPRPDRRAHAGRVRCRPDGGGHHPGRDEDDRDRDLRSGAGVRHAAAGVMSARSARLVAARAAA